MKQFKQYLNEDKYFYNQKEELYKYIKKLEHKYKSSNINIKRLGMYTDSVSYQILFDTNGFKNSVMGNITFDYMLDDDNSIFTDMSLTLYDGDSIIDNKVHKENYKRFTESIAGLKLKINKLLNKYIKK